MSFNDWFDVSDIRHINAFEYFQIHDRWPEDVLPKDISFSSGWYDIAMTQLADAYIDFMKSLCA